MSRVVRDLAKSYERERERSTQVNLKKWTAMLLSAKRLKVPYHWMAWLWERGRDHIESPFFFFHLYFIKNPSPNSHTKPLSLSHAFLQLHCQPLDSCLVTGQHHPSPSFLPLLENPVSLGLIQVVSKATQSCPPLTSHWIRLFMGQHHPICLFHSTSWNPLFLGTRLSHLRSDSVLNTSGPMTWQIQLDASKLNPCWKNLLFFPSLILGLNTCTTWWQPC